MNGHQYSLVHLTNAACPPPEMIYIAARAGFDCVSLRSIPTRMRQNEPGVGESVTGRMPFALADCPELLAQTRRAAMETGVTIHDTENARIFDGVNVRDYTRDLEAAAELGIHEILTNIWGSDPVFCREALEELCELAAIYNQNVNLEFVTWSSVPKLRDAATLLTRIPANNKGIVLDTLHFYRSRDSLSDLDGLPRAWFRYVHLCDCPEAIPSEREVLIQTGLEERMIPGEGAVDFSGILRRLPQVVRGLEVPNAARLSALGYEAYAKRILDTTKACLDGITGQAAS